MASSVFESVNTALSRVFPERRIYIRSDARTRYWTFSPISQCGSAIVIGAIIAWSGFTSLAFISKAMDGQTAENRLEASQEAYEIQLSALREQQRLLEEELNRSNARGDAVTSELSEKQQVLIDTAARLRTAELELSGLREEFSSVLAERREERNLINALNEDVVALRLALAETEMADAELGSTIQTFAATTS